MTTVDAILAATFDIRGRVLQRAIEIETLLDIYISEYFTKEKVKNAELINLLLAPRINFDNKVQIFTYLVDEYAPDFRKAYPKFTTEFKHIIEERNVFAHYPVDFSKESLENYETHKVVTFVKLKNSSEYKLPDGRKQKSLMGKRPVKEADINHLLQFLESWIKILTSLISKNDTDSLPL